MSAKVGIKSCRYAEGCISFVYEKLWFSDYFILKTTLQQVLVKMPT